MRSYEIGLITLRQQVVLWRFLEFRNKNASYISFKTFTTLKLLKNNPTLLPFSLLCVCVKIFVKHILYLFTTSFIYVYL